MLNINKIVELVELSSETGAKITVNVHDFQEREDAVAFTDELSRVLNSKFSEGGTEKTSWFIIHAYDDCEINIFYGYKEEEYAS